MRLLLTILAAALFVGACNRTEPSALPGTAPVTILLITIDTLRADHLGFDGYPLPTSPFLDRIAKEGVIFDQAYAPCSWTPVSMAALFTGMPGQSNGVSYGVIGRPGTVTEQPVLPDVHLTLAESLGGAGYQTVGVASNIHLASRFGFSQGFDFFHDSITPLTAPTVNHATKVQLRRAHGEAWHGALAAKPHFMWVHYLDPHGPYHPQEAWLKAHHPAFIAGHPQSQATHAYELAKTHPRTLTPEEGQAIGKLYDGEIHFTDQVIERLWGDLGIGEDTLVIITSDHGEELSDHGRLGHAHQVYEETVRVPFVVWWPKRIPGGRRVKTPVSLMDIYPTLASLTGASAPDILAGRDLSPILLDAAGALPDVPLFYDLRRTAYHYQAIRKGDLKLIHDRVSGSQQLFDLSTDPGEQNNLAASHPAETQALMDELTAYEASLPPAPPVEIWRIDDTESLEQLKALGYME